MPYLYAHILCAYLVDNITMKSFNQQAPKKATNLSVNSDLLSKAREEKINLSATFEKALADQLKLKQRERWREENEKAIRAYNDFVEDEGVFSNDIRDF